MNRHTASHFIFDDIRHLHHAQAFDRGAMACIYGKPRPVASTEARGWDSMQEHAEEISATATTRILQRSA